VGNKLVSKFEKAVCTTANRINKKDNNNLGLMPVVAKQPATGMTLANLLKAIIESGADVKGAVAGAAIAIGGIGSKIVTGASSVVAKLTPVAPILGVAGIALGAAYIHKKGLASVKEEYGLDYSDVDFFDPYSKPKVLKDLEAQLSKGKTDEGTSDSKEKEKTEEKLPNQGKVDGGVKDAPSVDAGKQGKHVPGHNNNDPGKSQWKDGKTGVKETQEGWQKGKELPDGTKVWDTGKPIGKNGETGVRIHIDGKGNIHGYPVNPGQYIKN